MKTRTLGAMAASRPGWWLTMRCPRADPRGRGHPEQPDTAKAERYQALLPRHTVVACPLRDRADAV